MICPDGSMITRTGTGGWRESRNASAPDWSSVYVVPTRSVVARDSLLHAVTPANTSTNSRPIARRFTGGLPFRLLPYAGAAKSFRSLRRSETRGLNPGQCGVLGRNGYPLARISSIFVAGGGSSVGRAPGLQPGGRGFESHPLHYPWPLLETANGTRASDTDGDARSGSTAACTSAAHRREQLRIRRSAPQCAPHWESLVRGGRQSLGPLAHRYHVRAAARARAQS